MTGIKLTPDQALDARHIGWLRVSERAGLRGLVKLDPDVFTPTSERYYVKFTSAHSNVETGTLEVTPDQLAAIQGILVRPARLVQ